MKITMETEEDTQTLTREVHLPSITNWGDDSWREKAACRGEEVSMFFPEKDDLTGLTPLQKRMRQNKKDQSDPNLPGNTLSRARILCVKCPVRRECLKFAVENNLTYGLYGGQPSRDRRFMTVENMDDRIPVKLLLVDLKRVRRVQGREKDFPFAYDLGLMLDVSTTEAQRMLDENDLPEYV